MGVGDVEALARAREGDNEGFRTLVERHGRGLFRLAFRMTGNAEDAEDVVQEAFLRAYRRLDQFEERAQIGSWLHRIAANCAFDLLRSRRRRADESPTDLDGPAPLPSAEPGPDRLVQGAEVRSRVGAAMGRMSELERSAFVLRHFEGMTIDEIGQALDLNASATKQSIFRAVRKVRAALAACDFR